MRLSVVIPVYNEKDTLRPLISLVLGVRLPVEKEIVLVDDGSTDGTGAISSGLVDELQGASVRLLRHERNRGKGAAVRTGIANATGDVILVQDADLEYDPQDYGKMLAPILQDRADVVFGSRFMGPRPRRFLGPRQVLANKVLTCLSNILGGMRLTDMCTCYKMFRVEVVQRAQLKQDRFAFDAELTMRIAAGRWRVVEVPISYCGRPRREGKKIGWWDFAEHVATILRCRAGA